MYLTVVLDCIVLSIIVTCTNCYVRVYDIHNYIDVGNTTKDQWISEEGRGWTNQGT